MPSHISLPPLNPSLLPSSLQSRWSPRSSGELKRQYGKPKLKNLIQVIAPLTACLSQCPFVPRSCSWAHVSRFACHPGARRTISLLKRHFWRPCMHTDAKEFVAACSTCARSKASNQAPASQLLPLPVPGDHGRTSLLTLPPGFRVRPPYSP